MREEMQVLTQENRARRLVVKFDIDYLGSLEEISQRQKSKALFIKECDNNTQFFHKIANSHRRTNQIREVEVDGVHYEDESDVTDQVVDFYKKLYQKPEVWRPTIDVLEFACLEETERSMLEREFEKEIIEALKEVGGDKSPRPNGFTMAFFQKCWSVIEGDVMAFFQGFSQLMCF